MFCESFATTRRHHKCHQHAITEASTEALKPREKPDQHHQSAITEPSGRHQSAITDPRNTLSIFFIIQLTAIGLSSHHLQRSPITMPSRTPS
jgi:hypothetical protein